ncbi:MAG TPA: 1-phosphofructokinase family hexose kinase [Acetobacteraceae bacterium]|nr:1-phosphofructokinase family hexose kinase [Acetobacteraceae bacterium]
MSQRIVTLTMNPALDLAADAAEVVPTHKIRMHQGHADPGGGGVNISRVLHELGADTVAIIAAGGASGRVLEELLDEAGVPRRSVTIRGQTRISINVQDLKHDLEYRFVPEGPTLSPDDFAACLAAVEDEPGAWLIASGSLPPGVPVDAYAQVARIARRKGQNYVVDTSGPALAATVEQGGCTLLKPSLNELEYLAGRELKDPAEQDREAMALVRRGAARMVAVTLGADGALLATEDGILRMAALDEAMHSSVGAGDAFVAAATLCLARGGTPAEALTWGTAAGAAAIACAGTARLRREDVALRHQKLTADARPQLSSARRLAASAA